MHLWPTRQQLTRPLKIILAVMFISIAITFYG
jgi:preprotein translocase subunit SecE